MVELEQKVFHSPAPNLSSALALPCCVIDGILNAASVTPEALPRWRELYFGEFVAGSSSRLAKNSCAIRDNDAGTARTMDGRGAAKSESRLPRCAWGLRHQPFKV